MHNFSGVNAHFGRKLKVHEIFAKKNILKLQFYLVFNFAKKSIKLGNKNQSFLSSFLKQMFSCQHCVKDLFLVYPDIQRTFLQCH